MQVSKLDETNDAIGDPETISAICAAVAIGGTLVAHCAEHGFDYKLINRWINDDDKRAERYALALTIREQHAKDLIIAELISYLKADVTEAFDADGNLKRMQDMPHNIKRLIAGVKFREIFEWQGEGKERSQVHVGNIIEVKFWDKPRSIETFMKHLSMLIDRKDINLKSGLADLIAGSMMKPEDKAA